jgi:hypothetical protein
VKGKNQQGVAPTPILSSEEIWMRVRHYPRIVEEPLLGKSVEYKFEGYGEWHNWVKRSIFWDLPYWRSHLIRHNLDVMHIEKNVFDNVFFTVMDISEKTKDNVKARLDLALHCSRPELELRRRPNGRTEKPKAKYTLSRDQRQGVCDWLKELRFPDGYASNFRRLVDKGKMSGWKSHDCHVFMERLVPIAFADLPQRIWKPLAELSKFFRDLYCTELREEDLKIMQSNIVLILYDLERIFPPSFFDSMEHLLVHLPYEALICGPVQYKWIYPFERYI